MTPDNANETETGSDDSASKAERTVDWLASLSDEELAEERRKAHQPISKETHPGTDLPLCCVCTLATRHPSASRRS